jgi:hypothetical protein
LKALEAIEKSFARQNQRCCHINHKGRSSCIVTVAIVTSANFEAVTTFLDYWVSKVILENVSDNEIIPVPVESNDPFKSPIFDLISFLVHF